MADTNSLESMLKAGKSKAQQTAKKEDTTIGYAPEDNPNGSVTEGRAMIQDPVKGSKGHTVHYENLKGQEIKADKKKPEAPKSYSYEDDKKATLAQLNEKEAKERADLQKQVDEEKKWKSAEDNMGQFIKLPEAPKEEAVEDFDDGVYRVTTPIGRYNYRIQHGWSIPSLDQDYLEFAKEENGMAKGYSNSQMKALQNQQKGEMSDRARQMALNRDKQAWQALMKRIQEGGFDDLPGRQRNHEEIFNAKRNLIQAWVNDGGQVDENGQPIGLWDIGGNMSGFKAHDKLAKKYSNDMVTMDQFMGKVAEDLRNETFGTEGKKSQYDQIINQIQMIIQGTNGGTQADAEKQRIQYLYLPPEMQQAYQREFAKYQKQLETIASQARSDKALNAVRANAKILNSSIESTMSDRSGNPMERVNGGNVAWKAFKGIEAGFSDLPVALDAVNAAWKAFNENINKIAVLDPNVLVNQIQFAKEISQRKYENTVQEGGGIPMSKTWNNDNAVNELDVKNWKNPDKLVGIGNPTSADYSPVDYGNDVNRKGNGNYGI